MNILIVTPGMHEPWVDGRITSLKTLAEALKKYGTNVEVLTTQTQETKSKTLQEDGVKYTLLPGGKIKNWVKLLKHFAITCRRSQFDVILYRPFSGFNWVNNVSVISLRLIAFIRRVPFVLSLWSGPAQFLKVPWIFSSIFITSPKGEHKNIRSIAPIITPMDIGPINKKEILASYGIKEKTHVFLFTYCAKVDTDYIWNYTMNERGLKDVINAAKLLSDKINFKFLISMPIFSNPSSVKKFFDILDAHGVRNRFTLAKEITSLPEVLSSVDAYLYPINMDEPSWAPVSALEALSYGTPVITTRVNIVQQFIKENEAFFFDPGHPEQLCSTIQFFLENQEKTKTIAIQAKTAIKSQFSSKNVANKIFNDLEFLIR